MKYFFVAFLSGICFMPGYAQVSPGNTPAPAGPPTSLADTLTEVVVSASREKQARKDVPAAISKITAETIKNTHATALYQLLNTTAGVYMVNLGNEQHTMAIRQPITYNALYLYMEDGLPIRPTGIFNHNALYEINMNEIKDIEVIKGPASSLYGSNAIGGSVNFITKDPFSPASNSISVQGDGYHYYRADASAALTKGRTGVLVAGYAGHQENSWQDYTDYDKYSATLKAVSAFNASTSLTVTGTWNYLNTQTPGSLDSARFYSRTYGSNQRFTYRKVNAFRTSARLDHRWSETNAAFLTVFFRNNSTGQLPSYYISDFRGPAGQYVSSSGQENNQSFNSYGLLLQNRSSFGFLRSQLIAGIYLDNSPSSYYATYLDIHKDLASNYYTGYTNTDSLIDNYSIRLLNTAAYLQYTIRPVSALEVVAGVRYDRVVYKFSNRLPEDRTRYKKEEKNYFDTFAPRLGATWDFGKGRGVYANFSTGVQPPETSNLYSSRQLERLKEATFYNYEAGGWVPLFSSHARIELSAYTMKGKNEIISVLMPDNTTQNQNAGSTRHSGIEYGLTIEPQAQWSFRFSGTVARHTYLQYSEISSGQTVSYDGNRMTGAPSSLFNTSLAWKPAILKGFRAAGEWQHIGSYYVDPANSRTYEGYDLLNLRFNYDAPASFARGLGIWFNVLNVTDILYAPIVTANQYGVTYNAAPPRTFALGISYSLSK